MGIKPGLSVLNPGSLIHADFGQRQLALGERFILVRSLCTRIYVDDAKPEDSYSANERRVERNSSLSSG